MFKFSGVGEGEDKIHPLKTGLSEQMTREANLLFFFVLDFDDSMFVKTSTAKEWIAQGEYYAKHQCWKVRGWASPAGLSPSCSHQDRVGVMVLVPLPATSSHPPG